MGLQIFNCGVAATFGMKKVEDHWIWAPLDAPNGDTSEYKYQEMVCLSCLGS